MEDSKTAAKIHSLAEVLDTKYDDSKIHIKYKTNRHNSDKIKRWFMAQNKILIDGESLTLDKIEFFLKSNPKLEITAEAKKRINKSRALVDKWVNNNEVIYGVTTGFGEFANVNISKENILELQENLIVSHAAGSGEYLPPAIVKIMMLLRLNALARGYSGNKIIHT